MEDCLLEVQSVQEYKNQNIKTIIMLVAAHFYQFYLFFYRIDDAYTLIQLYHKIHPDCESTKHKKDYLEALEAFIKLDSKKKEILQLTLQTYLSKNDSESAEKSSISN